MPTITTTSLDLLILALLQDRPMHGYELHQQIKAEGIDIWFELSMAGVYYSLGKLRDRGYITESRGHRTGGSDKAIYYVTETGRSAFFQGVELQVAGEKETRFDYDLSLFLLNRLPLQSALAYLERRRAFLGNWAERLRLRQAEGNPDRPAYQRAILDHAARFIAMERVWLEEVIRDVISASAATSGLQGGLMTLAGDLRHYHLPDLLRLIAGGYHTGTLTITDGNGDASIIFQAGRPVCLHHVPFDASPVDPAFTKERVVDLFRRQEGSFRFEQITTAPEHCTPVTLTTEELILDGCRRADRWEIIQRLVPSADTVYEVDMPLDSLMELHLSPQEAEISRALDGAHSIADIARQIGLPIFDVSRSVYCLAAIGAARVADVERIRVRRLFREIAELMCRSTLSLRRSPDDRTCEGAVNAQCSALPLRLVEGRIADQSDPGLSTGELVALYKEFLHAQYSVVATRFGRDNARQAYQRTIQQLVPELYDIAKRWGFDRLAEG